MYVESLLGGLHGNLQHKLSYFQFHNSCIVQKVISGSVLELPTSSHSALTKPSCRKQKYQLICQAFIAPRVNFTTAVKFFRFIFSILQQTLPKPLYIYIYFSIFFTSILLLLFPGCRQPFPPAPPATKTKLTPTPPHPPTLLPGGAPPQPGEAGGSARHLRLSSLAPPPAPVAPGSGPLRPARRRPRTAGRARQPPGLRPSPPVNSPGAAARCRPLRRHRALSSRHRSASGPPGAPRSAARSVAGHRGSPEASPEPSPAGPGRPRPPQGANGEVLTYLSLLSTPSWIHLSTSPQSIVGKPSPALLPARRPAGEGGGAMGTGRGRGTRGPAAAATGGGHPWLAALLSPSGALPRRLGCEPATSGGGLVGFCPFLFFFFSSPPPLSWQWRRCLLRQAAAAHPQGRRRGRPERCPPRGEALRARGAAADPPP